MAIMRLESGTAYLRCSCGKEFTAEYDPTETDEYFRDLTMDSLGRMICPECVKKREEKRIAELETERREELSGTIDKRIGKTGIPENFQKMDKPFVRHAAEWIYRNRENSLLISGETGAGKTSSACFIARLLMLRDEIAVRYVTRQILFADYVRAKTENGDNEFSFLSRLDRLDLLIIDELIGKKGYSKLSDSAQELLFNIVDGVYSKSRKTKVWILGNFHRGSITELVDDPEPLKRRLREAFKVAWFDREKVDENLKV